MNRRNGVTDSHKTALVDLVAAAVPIPRTYPAPTRDTAAISAEGHDRRLEVLADRRARLRLLAWSTVGVACLLLAQRLQPAGGAPFAAPSGPAAWAAAICGIAGIWLVPGLWLSAVLMRTGSDAVARLATRIGTTLVWYALVALVVHDLAEGARVTTGVIFGTTAAATAAVCLGVALGLLSRPAYAWTRVLIAAASGGACAQAAISLSVQLWTYEMNYEHIHRLDWLIVLACALLAASGQHCRPELPTVRAAGHVRTLAVSLAVLAAAVVLAGAVGSRWSPEQRMPSALSVEQVPAPPGSDLALALTAVGPQGFHLVRHAAFAASDDTGRPIRIGTRSAGEDQTADRTTLLVVVDPTDRPVLCERAAASPFGQDLPVKLTVRDQVSGVLVQAATPSGWCTR